MQTQTIIRAIDYMPKPNEIIENDDPIRTSQTDGMLVRLFGATPDYSEKKFEEIWQQVFDTNETDMISFCLTKGIDVLDNDKKPVSGWRDIAVMLKAIDAKILTLA